MAVTRGKIREVFHYTTISRCHVTSEYTDDILISSFDLGFAYPKSGSYHIRRGTIWISLQQTLETKPKSLDANEVRVLG
jgi:hypothetical protein